jgi:hypothetical protein
LVLHFCNDQIAYVSLVYNDNKLVDSATEDSCCATEDVNDEKGCCSNEEIKVEKKTEYSITKDFSSPVISAICTAKKGSVSADTTIKAAKSMNFLMTRFLSGRAAYIFL